MGSSDWGDFFLADPNFDVKRLAIWEVVCWLRKLRQNLAFLRRDKKKSDPTLWRPIVGSLK